MLILIKILTQCSNNKKKKNIEIVFVGKIRFCARHLLINIAGVGTADKHK